MLALLALAMSLVAPDYSGRWTLDAAHSTGLPPYYARVKSHTLAVAQSDSDLTVNVAVDIGAPEPDRIAFHYTLDGRETTTETTIRGPGGMMPVPTKLTATRAADGSLHVTISRHIAMGGQAIDAQTTEDWSLSPDGRTLTVHRVDDSPMGKVDAQMVFTRS